MRTVKIILAAALAIFMVASCKDPNFVSRQDYDALMKEYEDLQAGSAAIREEYAQQAKSVDNILEKLSQISRGMVASLKKVIAQKEAEIEDLKAEIAKRDATISEQHKTITEQSGTIENQNATISAQQENLRALLAEQAQMLFQAGVDFEDLGDEAPEVSLRKNKRKMAEFREAMYRKAIVYYNQAQAAGYPEAAYRISAVEEKLAQ